MKPVKWVMSRPKDQLFYYLWDYQSSGIRSWKTVKEAVVYPLRRCWRLLGELVRNQIEKPK